MRCNVQLPDARDRKNARPVLEPERFAIADRRSRSQGLYRIEYSSGIRHFAPEIEIEGTEIASALLFNATVLNLVQTVVKVPEVSDPWEDSVTSWTSESSAGHLTLGGS